MTRLAGPIEQQRARTAGLLAEATVIAADHARRSGAVGAPTVLLLPANARGIVPLPLAAREAFLAHVGALLDAAFAGAARDNTQPMSEEDNTSRVNAGDIAGDIDPSGLTAEVVAAACATCRGECCTSGGTHAFLRQDSVTRVRARLAEDGDDSAPRIAALYAGFLPTHHYRGSCVYHGEAGCMLPRDLRANLCNRYHCEELVQLGRALDGHNGGLYVGAADGTRLRGVTRLEPHADGTCAAEPLAFGHEGMSRP